MNLRLVPGPGLDQYQVIRVPPPPSAVLTLCNAFKLGNTYLANFMFEDDRCIYPYLFCEVRFGETVAELAVPSGLGSVGPWHPGLLESVMWISENRGRLGIHASHCVLHERSFLGSFLRQSRNVYRTPYVGLTDFGTQRRSFEIYRFFSEELTKAGRLRVLDVGCGSGYGAHLLGKAGLNVLAIDIEPAAVEFAKRIPERPNVRFLLADVGAVKASGETFDAAVLSEVLEHVSRPQELVEGTLGQLTPEGLLCVSLPGWRYHGVDLNSDHQTNWTLEKAHRFLTRYVEVRKVGVVNRKADLTQYTVEAPSADVRQHEHFLMIGERTRHSRAVSPVAVRRVLLVCHGIPPYEHTGTPIQTWQYARHLKALGVEVRVLTTSPSPSPGIEEREGITIHVVPRLPFSWTFLEALSTTDRTALDVIETVLANFTPDVVDIVDHVFLPPQIVQLAADYGAVVVRHVSNDEEICLRTSPFIEETRELCNGPDTEIKCARCALRGRPEENRLFTIRNESMLMAKIRLHREYVQYLYDSVVDCAVFHSRGFMEHFTQFIKIPSAKVRVIEQGIAPAGRKTRRSRTDGVVTIGFLGEIVAHKGLDLLAKALRALERDDYVLQVYGKVRDQKLLEELLSVRNVTYRGPYEPGTLADIMEQLDVGVVPSYFETYSRVLREFLAHGVPVIASRFFGSEVVEDGKNGLLFPVGDPGALGLQIARVLNDRALLHRLTEGALATKIVTPEEEAASLYSVYQELVEQKWGVRRGVSAGLPQNEGPRTPGGTETTSPTAPGASVIIPVFNNWQYTERCLKSLERTGVTQRAEVILVDNGSTDGTLERVRRQFPWVQIVRNETNLGFAIACNQGARVASSPFLVFLNNDTEVKPGWLDALLSAARRDPKVAVVGSKLLYPDGRIQHAGVRILHGLPYPLTAVHLGHGKPDDPAFNNAGPVHAVTGASMLVRRDVFWAVGGFDTGYKNGYEDVDLCLKVRQRGFEILYEPRSVAIHYESRTLGRHDFELENLVRLHRAWMPLVPALRTSPLEPAHRSDRPRVSVIVVTYNSLRTVAPCLDSVLSTLEPGDELIVVDNGSRDETAAYLTVVSKMEPEGRITVQLNQENLGYAAAAAKGARTARNPFVIFVNPDVVVGRGWIEGLLEPMLRDGSVAAAGPVSNYAAGCQNVSQYVEAEVVRQTVEWDRLRSQLELAWKGKTLDTKLLIGFCLAVRREALEKVGGLDESLFLGNDDLDLSWRLGRAGYRQVVVPSVFVLHHGQVSFNTEPKVRTAYLVQQSTNQLYEKLYQVFQGNAPSGRDLWGIDWFRPQAEVVTVVIPVRHGPAVTKRCLESVVRHTRRLLEVVIVDNDADAPTKDVIDEFASRHSNVVVIRNEHNVGYPVACNQGIARARGEYIVVMNNDVVVTPHWASRLLAAFSVDPNIGAVGPRTNFAVGPQQVPGAAYAGEDLDEWAQGWFRKNAGRLRLVGRLIGFLMVIKREAVEQVGGFDPLFGIGNFEDDDLSLRLQLAGYKLAIADDVFVHHEGSQSFRQDVEAYARLLEVNRRLFAAKWGLTIRDGAYDPQEVLRRRDYRRSDLYIPLSFDAIFSPQGEKLDLGLTARRILLCVPDPSDSEGAWVRWFEQYLKETTPRDGLGLVVRVEPAEEAWLRQVVSAMQQVAVRLGVDLDARDDIVVEARAIPSTERGAVYRAATDFVSLPGVRQQALAREARACGLRIVCGSDASGLSALLASAGAGGGR